MRDTKMLTVVTLRWWVYELFYFPLCIILYYPNILNITCIIRRIYCFKWIAYTICMKAEFILGIAYLQQSIQILTVLDGFLIYAVKPPDQNIEHI